MIDVRQIESSAFALLSYLLVDRTTGECLIIDPPRDITTRVNQDELFPRAVINTHLHPDHTLGNPSLAGEIPILAHPGEKSLFLRMVYSTMSALFTGRIQRHISYTLAEGTIIMLGNTSIEVMHTPGHSPGSICLYWEGNLISGDTIFIEGIGRTDIPGGSPSDLTSSIERILLLPPDTMVWPGHSYGHRYSSRLAEITPMLRWMLTQL
ncbi:MAG: MBL fold metallo-hydrolase [Desulfomonilia bacterium]